MKEISTETLLKEHVYYGPLKVIGWASFIICIMIGLLFNSLWFWIGGGAICLFLHIQAEIIQILHDIRRTLYQKEIPVSEE